MFNSNGVGSGSGCLCELRSCIFSKLPSPLPVFSDSFVSPLRSLGAPSVCIPLTMEIRSRRRERAVFVPTCVIGSSWMILQAAPSPSLPFIPAWRKADLFEVRSHMLPCSFPKRQTRPPSFSQTPISAKSLRPLSFLFSGGSSATRQPDFPRSLELLCPCGNVPIMRLRSVST